jgi:large subunit ribosomal protein L13
MEVHRHRLNLYKTMTKYTLDAKGKKLGRLATEAAKLLMGKNTTDYARNVIPDVEVIIINAGALEISDKKKDQEEFKYYSGYPGGLRTEKLGTTLEKKGVGEVVKKTVYGMLPTNKLRARMIKKLTVNE